MLGLVSFIGLLLTWALKLLQIAAKAAVFMIVKMGMWLPALYAVGYYFVCAGMGISHGDPVAIKVLWIGVVVCAAVGFVGSNILFEYRRRKQKFGTFAPEPFHFHGGHQDKQEQAAAREPSEQRDMPSPQSEYVRGYRDAMVEVQRERERAHEREQEREKWRAEERERIRQEESKRQEPPAPSSPPPKEVPVQTAAEEGSSRSRRRGFEPVPDRFSASRQAPRHATQEEVDIYPLVFVMRNDPDMLIVEYSDRLVYFRRDPRGGKPIFVASEFKNGY